MGVCGPRNPSTPAPHHEYRRTSGHRVQAPAGERSGGGWRGGHPGHVCSLQACAPSAAAEFFELQTCHIAGSEISGLTNSLVPQW